MQIEKDALLHLTTTGYVTLQVPAYQIFIPQGFGLPSVKPEDVPPKEMMEIPDDYIYELKFCGSKMRPTIGKEQGFIYITKKGYENLKPLLRESFLDAFHNGRSRQTTDDMTDDEAWAVFEKYAEQHFAEIELCIAKQLKQYQDKVNELKNLTP